MPMSLTTSKEKRDITNVRKLTGRPTEVLRREILLTPTLSFTFLLNVNLGLSNEP